MYADSRTYTHEKIENYNIQKNTRINCARSEDRRSEQRIIRNRIRRQQEIRKNSLILVLTICLTITCTFTLSVFHSNAKNDSKASYKYYKSITVSNHDTLWSIAEKYMEAGQYNSIQDYIGEIKRINSLPDDSIHYGDYLIIPCHSSNPVE